MALPPQERYQFKPFIGSSHHWAIEKINSIDRECTVLDIGTGSGAIGKVLREKGFKQIYGIEIDDSAREHAKNIYVEIHRDLEKFSGRKFDVILLLDVLEHLTDPESFLKILLQFCAPGCTILISVPNIAHWSVRFSLFFGVFNYTSRGILDRTHYSHFTRARLSGVIYDAFAGMNLEWSSSVEPVELLLPRFVWDNSVFRLLSKVRIRIANVFPGLFAYQHLVRICSTPHTTD